MKTIGIFLALALSSSPMPAENYYSWISPEIAEEITNDVISGNTDKLFLDFNGDGKLTIADAVGVKRRYEYNCTYGNNITLSAETVYSIAEENFTDDVVYYEIDNINGNSCREYELTTECIITCDIYYEFADYSKNIKVEINPFTETTTVI